MNQVIQLKQNQSRLTFSKNNGGIRTIEKGEKVFKFSKEIIWQIILRNTDKEKVTVSNKNKSTFKYNIADSKIFLIWDMKEDFNGLRIVVTAKLENGLSYWKINVKNNTGYIIQEVDFPYIGGIGKISKNSGKDYLVIPWQWGILVPDPIEFIAHEEREYVIWDGKERNAHQLAYEYPGMYSMQFLAYGNPVDKKGLYIGVNDDKANYKRFGFYGYRNCKEADYILKNYPEKMDKSVKEYKMPYETVISIFDGEWWQASNIYKTWALRQEWCNNGKISKRKDIPGWLKEIGLYYWNWMYWQKKGEPEDIIPALVDLKKRMNVPILFHWYGWDDRLGDTVYPEYSLSKKGRIRLDKAMKKFKEEKIRVIPYMNGRLWNVDTKSWYEEKAGNYACQQEGLDDTDTGKYYIEPWAERPFVIMCPFTKFWQDKIISETKKVIGYGVDGAYIDQVSSAYAVQCFAKNHKHNSGGNYWYKGYEILMDRLRKQVRKKYPESIFTSESVIECFIRTFDAFLGYQCSMFYFTKMFGKDSITIPLFTSVYSGYIPIYSTGTTIQKDNEFYFGTALDICGGVQPSIQGYFREHIDKKEYEQKLNYLEEMVKKYNLVKKELIDAEWLPVSDIKINTEKIRFSSGITQEVPAVLTSLWKSNEEEIIFFAINHTDKIQKMEFSFIPEKYSMKGKYNLVKIDIDKEYVLQKNNKEIKLNIFLRKKSVNVYKFTKID